MGLRQTIAQWVVTAKDTLDFGPEFPAALVDHRVRYVEELERLQGMLDEARKAAQEKDELIARLQAAATVRGTMIVDESAYYIKKGTTLDGPFCTSCFEQSHEIARIAPAPKPKNAAGEATEWVQCTKCQTPFRSERVGQFLHPRQTAAAPTGPCPAGRDETKPQRPVRKPRSRLRPPQDQPPESTGAIPGLDVSE